MEDADPPPEPSSGRKPKDIPLRWAWLALIPKVVEDVPEEEPELVELVLDEGVDEGAETDDDDDDAGVEVELVLDPDPLFLPLPVALRLAPVAVLVGFVLWLEPEPPPQVLAELE